MTAKRATLPREPTMVEPPMIRALFLGPLIQELQASGLQVEALLQTHGLCASHAARPYELVPLRSFVALVEDIAERLNRPFLGLEVGQHLGVDALAPFSAVLRLAQTLRAALENLARFHPAWQTHTKLEIVRAETTTVLRYAIFDSAIGPRRQNAEFAMASLCTTIRQLSTGGWRPLEVQFQHDVETRRARLNEFFRAKITGHSATNLMIIANEAIDRPLHWHIGSEDRALLPSLERHLHSLLGGPNPVTRNCADRVRMLIGRRLGASAVDIESIAAEMSVSARSLRRRLSCEGTSFRRILQEQRYAEMRAVLTQGTAPLMTLADRLSYSDSSALSRAFKSWAGVSPREYARAHR
jgi:AraC-like DNA-binding protein